MNLSEFLLIAPVIELPVSNSKIKWTDDNGETIKEGVVRRVCREDGSSAGAADVRDLYIEVTCWTTTVMLSVVQCGKWMQTGSLAVVR